jgi:hypothetical protein
MSDRKKGGGLDYTPQAFPGARAPDGPAPDLGDKLAKMGLVEGTEATDARMDARVDSQRWHKPWCEKARSAGLHAASVPRCASARWASSRPARSACADGFGRADRGHLLSGLTPGKTSATAPAPPRRAEPAAPRFEPSPAPAVRREPAKAPSRKLVGFPSTRFQRNPADELLHRLSPPMPEPPRRTERAVAPEPAPRRTERAALASAPATPQPQPVYVVPPPASATPLPLPSRNSVRSSADATARTQRSGTSAPSRRNDLCHSHAEPRYQSRHQASDSGHPQSRAAQETTRQRGSGPHLTAPGPERRREARRPGPPARPRPQHRHQRRHRPGLDRLLRPSGSARGAVAVAHPDR